MKGKDIREGETYQFVATESASRKHLEGEEFKVVRIARVWRRFSGKGRKKLQRFFNEAGDGARAEELEPLNEKVCHICLNPSDAVCCRCEQDVCENCLVFSDGKNPIEETRCKTCHQVHNDNRQF